MFQQYSCHNNFIIISLIVNKVVVVNKQKLLLHCVMFLGMQLICGSEIGKIS